MEQDVKALFGKVWPVHVHEFTRFLLACRKAFDGDLDMLLVLAVIGDCTFSRRHADAAMTYEDFQAGKASLTKPVGVNVRSVAEYSGIPRETVRRKINQLIARGWVVRDENEFLTASRRAAGDLQPLTEASIAYVAGMMQLLRLFSAPADEADAKGGAGPA